VRGLGRASGSAAGVHEAAICEIVLTIPRTAANIRVSEPTASSALSHLVRLGVLEEITGKRRNKTFAYRRYLDLLSEGLSG
jgi:Fic family protein